MIRSTSVAIFRFVLPLTLFLGAFLGLRLGIAPTDHTIQQGSLDSLKGITLPSSTGQLAKQTEEPHLFFSKGHPEIPFLEPVAELEEIEEDHFPEDDSHSGIPCTHTYFLHGEPKGLTHSCKEPHRQLKKSLVVLYHRWKLDIPKAKA